MRNFLLSRVGLLFGFTGSSSLCAWINVEMKNICLSWCCTRDVAHEAALMARHFPDVGFHPMQFSGPRILSKVRSIHSSLRHVYPRWLRSKEQSDFTVKSCNEYSPIGDFHFDGAIVTDLVTIIAMLYPKQSCNSGSIRVQQMVGHWWNHVYYKFKHFLPVVAYLCAHKHTCVV